MAEAQLIVQSVGPMVSFQDAGRPGKLRYGVCASGPMDRFSYRCANVALGRPANSVVVEISLGGLILDCIDGEVSIAITGGEPVIKLNGTNLTAWCVTSLRSGDRLSIRGGSWGSFSYLSFAGELQCSTWLGSAATHSLADLGGGSLQPGQDLRVESALIDPQRSGDLPIPDCARPSSQVRVVTGPQDAYFTEESLSDFLTKSYTLSAAFDRMGVRLEGPHLSMGDALSIPSEPIVRGSVQVSGDGSATVLLADHQTTGGYPKIATVLSAETDRLAQLRSGQSVMFESVTPQEAIAWTRKLAVSRANYLDTISKPRGTFEYRLISQNLIDGVIDGY